MNLKSDLELINMIKMGDEKALEVLYDRYASAVMGFAYKILGNDDYAAEIVQETFIRIWDRCDRFQSDRGKFTTWMFGIARNLAIDNYRKLKIRPEAASSESEVLQMERASDSSSPIEESVAGHIQNEKVQQLVQALPDKEREIIELSFFQGLTRVEIAQKTGIALGTVNSRARRAMQNLKSELQGALS